ncbi:hypothetical protein GCM10010304_01530 [Streptomyces roseoviolaceus]
MPGEEPGNVIETEPGWCAIVVGTGKPAFKLLYNSTVAMTGGQDPAGALALDQVARLLLAEGVSKVVITTEDDDGVPWRRLPAGVAVRSTRRRAGRRIGELLQVFCCQESDAVRRAARPVSSHRAFRDVEPGSA